ncbi:dihydrolipoamide acetyltransferase [Wickerhamomyces ciferrii]|uniref:Acetyltransferase component of pyruvate dehydrogenase complex n=1 Tax=Wickerhamomyces ciferrii (strain ATCC 14091 / BCRC 22168 / CBS 111 / JCM 3599 / NBRC 0793 / NRRL Y-1031 F-60-10) TaxID=1206466 RepID=K0KM97_WICCF|nr:dihydrolipoamide acetyltransferase [Wickerhamomyces ciferrii]CCH42504.1 dihydrolipoamide acetyltransferase [Wickerhamomyces ciferrii]
MPALSPTMTQGNLAVWNKAVGDELQPGEAIAEIETDKAQMDFEFQEEGFLAKILVEAGAKDIPVNTPIAVYVEDKANVEAFKDFTAESKSDSAPKEAPKEESKSESKPTESSGSAPAKKSSGSSAPTDRIIASPLAKTIALDKGISLKQVTGTGPNGRIVKEDVEKYIASGAGQASASPAAATAATSEVSYTDIPITNMRKIIGKRLLESTQTNPSYIVSSQISVSKLLKLRASLNSQANDRYKLSINDILIKAISSAAQRVPEANSHWIESEGVIRQYNNVDVSVAVATPSGLITPIVKNAHSKGLVTISSEVKDLGKRAKDNKLKPEEFQGGTICISNLGMNHAVNLFTSIINPPQSTILAISTVTKVAVPDNANPNGFIFDDKINITGTFDHRVVDGAKGGEFIKALKEVIENPLELLL